MCCPSHPNVLVVDDDPAMLRLLSKWLERSGYQVRHAGDGQQALTAIESQCPDFLITDWAMPNLDGLQLCRKVRELNLPHYVYIIFLTVKSTPSEMVKGLEVGADDFLTKPVHQEEIIARMRAGSRVLELERRLTQLARTDQLTGLMTQRTFYDILQKEWQRSRRGRLPLSCVMLDIDFFKRINDSHGHPAGDAVLKAVAKLLEECCRTSDSVSRYGGEEFCVMLPETFEDDAAMWAERARERLSTLVVPVGGKTLRVTASFGVAQKHDDVQTPEQLVDQADQALLCAKQSGRDRVVRYESLNDANDIDLKKDKLSDVLDGITALHVMTPMVVCLREHETVGSAAEFFLRSRINSTPVVDENGKLSGILSEKDLMAAMVSLECWKRPVREVMKPNVICYEEDTPIRTIYEFLCRVSVRRIVIVNDDRPTGTISRGTLLRWFRNVVLTSGLMEGGTSGGDVDLAPFRSKERLAETAGELAEQASELRGRFNEDAEDLVPHVVGGATRMQELVDDLLAFSRYANETTTGAAALQSMMLSGSHTD